MSQPPAPMLSPDGRFYWDGQAWRPYTAAPPPAPPQRKPSPHALRNVLIVAGLIVVAAALIGQCGNAGGGNGLKLDANFRHLSPSSQGGEGAYQVTVTDRDTDIADLWIYYDADSDNWLDHHVVTNLGGCSIDRSLRVLKCGPLKAGASTTIDVVATAKDRGNYSYGWALADGGGASGHLRQWGTKFTWQEAVT